jgi:hypothetical protein
MGGDTSYADLVLTIEEVPYDLPFVDIVGELTKTGSSICYNPVFAIGFYDDDGQVVGVVDATATGPIGPGESERIDADDLAWLNEPYVTMKTQAQCSPVESE